MFNGLLDSIRALRWFALWLLVPLAVLVWANVRNARLLGDDNESTENIEPNRGPRSSGHARFYHK